MNWFNGVSGDFLSGTFWLFCVILLLHTALNIGGSHLVARINGISVWWHVLGVRGDRPRADLRARPPRERELRLHGAVQQLRLPGGATSGGFFWFYVLPLGFLLTQYTITGFDSCAHISEETHGAAENAAKGVWRSVFYSAIVRLDRAAGDHVRGREPEGDQRGRRARRLSRSRSSTWR